MNGLPLISISAEVMSGTPVFHGTRVPVKNLIDYLSTGETLEEFLEDFPTVRREQAIAFLEEAAQHMIADYAYPA
jgi:uncharacterized protein (DUF433 family)